MASTRLLQAMGMVAILAAAPAFAQTNTPPADTGAGGAPNTPTTNEAPPADNSGAAAKHSHGAHRMTMAHATRAGRADAQDAEVDRLNDQSYQAARAGAANAPSAAPAATDTSTGAPSK